MARMLSLSKESRPCESRPCESWLIASLIGVSNVTFAPLASQGKGVGKSLSQGENTDQ